MYIYNISPRVYNNIYVTGFEKSHLPHTHQQDALLTITR